MLANNSNRAPLKTRLLHGVIAALLFTAFFEIKNYFFDNEPFEWELALGSFLIFGILATVMNYFTLKNKEK